jgi:hypothetical protein
VGVVSTFPTKPSLDLVMVAVDPWSQCSPYYSKREGHSNGNQHIDIRLIHGITPSSSSWVKVYLNDQDLSHVNNAIQDGTETQTSSAATVKAEVTAFRNMGLSPMIVD